jgi:hypothetical protein
MYPDYVVIFDTIAMITIFCSVVLSVIQGVAHNTGVLPFSKGRALHYDDPDASDRYIVMSRDRSDLVGTPAYHPGFPLCI